MKPTLLLLALTPLASAWQLELWSTDGRKSSMHGRLDSGCTNIAFTPPLDVNRARLRPQTDWLPDPSTFELYVGRDCKGLSYRNGGGDHRLRPARVVRSYKVY